MEKPNHHILVCASFRGSGEPQGVCHKKGALNLLQYMQSELSDRGMSGVAISATGCLNVCDRGPALVVYPQNIWYGNIESEEAIDAIIDGLESGIPAAEFELK